MRRLPTFMGYTVDARLREFRRAEGEPLEFISFDSEQSQWLLMGYRMARRLRYSARSRRHA